MANLPNVLLFIGTFILLVSLTCRKFFNTNQRDNMTCIVELMFFTAVLIHIYFK